MSGHGLSIEDEFDWMTCKGLFDDLIGPVTDSGQGKRSVESGLDAVIGKTVSQSSEGKTGIEGSDGMA